MTASSTIHRGLSTRPLRIALFSTQAAWHGGEAQAALFAAGLKTRGHEVRIFARQAAPFAERMSEAGYEVFTFACRGRTPVAIWQNRRRLQRYQPHVLFYNDPHSLTAGALAAAGLRIPVRLAARRVDFSVRSAWRYLHGADRVVCVSSAVQAACIEGGIPASRLCVVHDGVEPTRMEAGNRQRGRAALGLAEETPLLMSVAKLTDHKGHTYLLQAMPEIIARWPQVCLALAGDGELTETLRKEAQTLGIADRVRFLGFRADVPDLVQAADVFVMPSHMEGLNTSIIDAMLAARPIVTTTAGGIPDLMGVKRPSAGPAGWVVPPRIPSALSAAILAALASPMQGAVFGAYARERALSRFTADCMVEGTLAVIEEILTHHGRQAA